MPSLSTLSVAFHLEACLDMSSCEGGNSFDLVVLTTVMLIETRHPSKLTF